MEKIFGYPLGWLMYLIYKIFGNYGVSLIVFTIIAKLLLFPLAVKNHKNSAKQKMLMPKLEKIQKSYAGNPQRMQEEQMKLYQEEGYNPMASCLPMLIQFPVLFGILDVVYRPLTHILRLGSDTISKAQEILQSYLDAGGITEKAMSGRPELVIMKYAKENPSIFDSLDGFADKVNSFENTLFGILDFGRTPTLSPDVWDASAIALVIIPVLSGVFQLILTIYQQRKQNVSTKGMQGAGMMNVMLYGMPLFSVWIAFSFPAGIGFYWAISSFFSLIQTIALYAYYTPERTQAAIEKDKQKQKQKGGGFMQRMLEQQQAAAGQSAAGSRVIIDTDGKEKKLSRSEQNDYNLKAIKAARKRMAEKYGDEYNDGGDE